MAAKKTEIERGCVREEEAGGRLGCYARGNPENGFQEVVCYCDTNRCNGLSVEALVAQILHLPLDGDLSDHSGLGHHGTVPSDRSAPVFTCLDRFVNCSAYFSGAQCIEVPSIGRARFGSVEVTGNETAVVPRVTFVVSYKRLPSPHRPHWREGVFGNSASSASQATWVVYAEDAVDASTAGIITDGTRLQSTEDYRYAEAKDGVWHQHVLVYDGKNSPLATLKYFVDGREMIGNARLENGGVSLRDQPVTIGCAEGLYFTGLVDEVRIFSTNLDRMDVEALLIMNN